MFYMILFYPILNTFLILVGLGSFFFLRILLVLILVFLLSKLLKRFDPYISGTLLNNGYIQRFFFECMYAESVCRRSLLVCFICFFGSTFLILIYIFSPSIFQKFPLFMILYHMLFYYRFRSQYCENFPSASLSWERCIFFLNKQSFCAFEVVNKLDKSLSQFPCIYMNPAHKTNKIIAWLGIIGAILLFLPILDIKIIRL